MIIKTTLIQALHSDFDRTDANRRRQDNFIGRWVLLNSSNSEA
jgi:hypothetical protein